MIQTFSEMKRELLLAFSKKLVSWAYACIACACLMLVSCIENQSQSFDLGLFDPIVFEDSSSQSLNQYLTEVGWEVHFDKAGRIVASKQVSDELYANVDVERMYNDQGLLRKVRLNLYIITFSYTDPMDKNAVRPHVKDDVLRSNFDKKMFFVKTEGLMSDFCSYHGWDQDDWKTIETKNDGFLNRAWYSSYENGGFSSDLTIHEPSSSEYITCDFEFRISILYED